MIGPRKLSGRTGGLKEGSFLGLGSHFPQLPVVLAPSTATRPLKASSVERMFVYMYPCSLVVTIDCSVVMYIDAVHEDIRFEAD